MTEVIPASKRCSMCKVLKPRRPRREMEWDIRAREYVVVDHALLHHNGYPKVWRTKSALKAHWMTGQLTAWLALKFRWLLPV